jgi:2-polyprenyl-3-methyl-5-hydroxy-6-metoxy-1,4-benzoquinol methylase
MTPGRKLLDVGCGDGQLLKTAQKEGWDPMGIDLSEPAIRLCRKASLPASKTDFFDEVLDPQRFDAIVMSELLEHVPAPQRFLKRAEELLRPGGVLYLTTPNFGSLGRRMLGAHWSVVHPEHIGYFERDSLKAMLRDWTGLRAIKIEANNIAPSTFVAWLRSITKQSQQTSVSESHRQSRAGIDQQLRRKIQSSRSLRASKRIVNHVVSRAGIGDTLVAWLRKQPASG